MQVLCHVSSSPLLLLLLLDVFSPKIQSTGRPTNYIISIIIIIIIIIVVVIILLLFFIPQPIIDPNPAPLPPMFYVNFSFAGIMAKNDSFENDIQLQLGFTVTWWLGLLLSLPWADLK